MIKIPKLPWLIAGMLFFSTLINYTARLTLSVVVGKVLREFSMTDRDYAQIVSLFLVAYAVMYAGSGYVVDRQGTRRGFALFVSAWSAAQVLSGFVLGKWSLAACQFGLGLAEPGNFPAGVKTVHEWFPPHQRAAAVGLFNAGSSLGAALGAPVAAFLAVRYGWRSAFFFTGALGFVWLAMWLTIYPSPGSPRWFAARKESGLEDSLVESGGGCHQEQAQHAPPSPVAPMLHADPGALLNRPRHLFHSLLASAVPGKGKGIRYRHGGQVRLGTVFLWRRRIHFRRMAFRTPDARGLEPAAGAQDCHAGGSVLTAVGDACPSRAHRRPGHCLRYALCCSATRYGSPIS